MLNLDNKITENNNPNSIPSLLGKSKSVIITGKPESSFARKVFEESSQDVETPKRMTGLSPLLSEKEFLNLKSSYGSKYANLCKAHSLIENNVFVSQCGISDEQIKGLLSDQTKELWNQACHNHANFHLLKSCLDIVQANVKKDILESEFIFTEEQEKFLSKHLHTKLIVRSTSDEDNEECVNAGGNKSIGGVASREELKQAIATVVTSYFSYRSIKKRLNTQDALERLPLCSVLLMEQIVEESDNDLIASGVMITHQNNWGPLSEGRMTSISAT